MLDASEFWSSSRAWQGLAAHSVAMAPWGVTDHKSPPPKTPAAAIGRGVVLKNKPSLDESTLSW